MEPPTSNSIKISNVQRSGANYPPTPIWQYSLSLKVEKQVERSGIWMGVLNDGTPFLSQRGLAKLCGIAPRTLRDIENEWNSPERRNRIVRIKELLSERGVNVDTLYLDINYSGTDYHAFPDSSCLAILEYFAFDARGLPNDTAITNYRKLAGSALREMIYLEVGYDPRNRVPPAWIQFRDRMSLVFDSVPPGYFSVFKEISDMMVTLIMSGAEIGTDFVPDISVGQRWAKYWRDNNLREKYGEERKYEHNYPDYFPQSKSNPQDSYCYPDTALPEFRNWMRSEYIPRGLPAYIKGQVSRGKATPALADLVFTQISNRGAGYIGQ